MAKSKINEKIIGQIILEVEDEGEVDLFKYLKKFNESYIKISISDKVESEPEE